MNYALAADAAAPAVEATGGAELFAGAVVLTGPQGLAIVVIGVVTIALVNDNNPAHPGPTVTVITPYTGDPFANVFEAKKPDIKRVEDVAKELGIKDRRGFGDFVEDSKNPAHGERGNANERGDYGWKDLVRLGKEWLEGGGQ